jgi:hypothetical protein
MCYTECHDEGALIMGLYLTVWSHSVYSYIESQRDALFLKFIWWSTLPVSDMSTVHHQEFQHCIQAIGIWCSTNYYTGTADGGTVVKVLRYKSEGRWFDSRWCRWNFSLTYGPGVDSASNRNEYQEYFLGGKGGRCVRLTNLPLSRAVVM